MDDMLSHFQSKEEKYRFSYSLVASLIDICLDNIAIGANMFLLNFKKLSPVLKSRCS